MFVFSLLSASYLFKHISFSIGLMRQSVCVCFVCVKCMAVTRVCMHMLMECVCMELLMSLRVSLACACRHVGRSVNTFVSACVCESVCVRVCVWVYCRFCQRTPPIKVEMHAVTYSQMSPFLPDRPHSMRKGSKQICVCVCECEWARESERDRRPPALYLPRY